MKSCTRAFASSFSLFEASAALADDREGARGGGGEAREAASQSTQSTVGPNAAPSSRGASGAIVVEADDAFTSTSDSSRSAAAVH